MDFSAKLELNSLQKILKRRGLEKKGEVQRFVDSEILRLSEPYVPVMDGILKGSGKLNTVVGSGKVVYKTPYAKRQYYAGRAPGTSTKGSLRGRQWFERMKNSHLHEILQGAREIAGADE